MPSIPTATVSRLVTYLRILSDLEPSALDRGAVTSARLADAAQVSAFQVRKDLTHLKPADDGREPMGTRGVGYSVVTLRSKLRDELGLSRECPWRVAIVGMGRLGHALVDYPGLEQYNFVLEAGFDVDPTKIVRERPAHADPSEADGWLPVFALDELPAIVRERGIDIGFVTVPPRASQAAADALVAAGITGILNFSPTVIDAPAHVHVESVDFLAGLKRLAYYIHQSRHVPLEEESA